MAENDTCNEWGRWEAAIIMGFRHLRERYLRSVRGRGDPERAPVLEAVSDSPELSGSPLCGMPVDMKLYILSFLSPQDVCVLGMTNLCWHELVQDPLLWRYFLLRDLPSWSSIECHNLPDLDILNSYLSESPEGTPHDYRSIYLKSCPKTRRSLKSKRPIYGAVTSFLQSLVTPAEPRFAMFGPGLEQLDDSLFRRMMTSPHLLPVLSILQRQIEVLSMAAELLYTICLWWVNKWQGCRGAQQRFLAAYQLVDRGPLAGMLPRNVAVLLYTLAACMYPERIARWIGTTLQGHHQGSRRRGFLGRDMAIRSQSSHMLLYLAAEGIGSGVTFQFDSQHKFNILTLYSTTSKERDRARVEQSVTVNKMFLPESPGETQQAIPYSLIPAVQEVCKVVDGFIYVANAEAHKRHNREDEIALILAMTDPIWGLPMRPLLVLSCVTQPGERRIPCVYVAHELSLNALNRPWMVQNTDASTLSGLLDGIEWILGEVGGEL